MADNPLIAVARPIVWSERFVARFAIVRRVERFGPRC